MTRGCYVCGHSPAKKASCCGVKLCALHGESCAAHRCPTQARMVAMTPADVKRWKQENAPEQTLTTEVIAALNRIPGVEVWRAKRGRPAGGQSTEADGVPDVIGVAAPDGRWLAIETKREHKDGCPCDHCAAQRDFGRRLTGAGGVFVLARTVAQAVDGVRMGLARARGERAA